VGGSHSSLQLHVSASIGHRQVALLPVIKQNCTICKAPVIGDEISFTMSYISYNYCNLNRVEYSGTDITSISDDVLSEAGIMQMLK